jgi:hypothetical protein
MTYKLNQFTGLPDRVEDVSGYVPYTGATADLNLGSFSIFSNTLNLYDPVNDNYGNFNYSDGSLYVPGDIFTPVSLGIYAGKYSLYDPTNENYGDITFDDDTLYLPGVIAGNGSGLTNLSASSISSGTLGVARGGTGTSTAFTLGSLVFAGASGVYSQNNANIFWDNTNNRLGLGITSPLARIHVVTNSASSIGQIIQGAFAQTANLTEWRNSAATIFSRVDNLGQFGIATGTTALTTALNVTGRISLYDGVTRSFNA